MSELSFRALGGIILVISYLPPTSFLILSCNGQVCDLNRSEMLLKIASPDPQIVPSIVFCIFVCVT